MDAPDSLCECVVPHFPCVTVSFCYPFDLCLPGFHYNNVFLLCNEIGSNVKHKKVNVRETNLLVNQFTESLLDRSISYL